MNETVSRPVAQVNNPIKAPLWKTTTMQFMNETWAVLDTFCGREGYSKRDVVDVALREYLKMPEPKE